MSFKIISDELGTGAALRLVSSIQSINSTTSLPHISFAGIVKPHPTRRQTILFTAIDNFQFIDYVVGVGRLIGPASILCF